jgi:hypothetical protein
VFQVEVYVERCYLGLNEAENENMALKIGEKY